MKPDPTQSQFIPTYLPPVQYFAAIAKCENIDWVIDGLYIKQTIRNRCTILDANGPLDLIIPVQKSNSKKLYKDVKISYENDWARQHLRALASAYGSSPFFYYYKDKFENILATNYNFLVDLNLDLINLLFQIYKIKNSQTKLELAEQTIINPSIQKQAERAALAELAETQPQYPQVFTSKFGFVKGLSIIDMLFNNSKL